MEEERRLKIVESKDGSLTYKSLHYNEAYHSKAGALTESNHIFIKNGVAKWLDSFTERGESSRSEEENSVTILEAGFGTGLNCLATLYYLQQLNLEEQTVESIPPPHFTYISLELHPLNVEQLKDLKHHTLFPTTFQEEIEEIYNAPWDREVEITPNFSILKYKVDIIEFFNREESTLIERGVDICYWDTFSPRIQPNLWSRDLFNRVVSMMNDHSLLVTYSVKGDVRRGLESAGLEVTKVAGPPGKREICVAMK